MSYIVFKNEADVLDLKQAKETLVSQLTEISKTRRKVRSEDALRSELSSLETTLTVQTEDLVRKSIN